MKLKCDCCGRIETEPYDEGDTCYDGCGTFIKVDKKAKLHRWSGRPGCYCLNCGAEHALENAIAMGWVDNRGHWDTDEHRLMVSKADSKCLAEEADGTE